MMQFSCNIWLHKGAMVLIINTATQELYGSHMIYGYTSVERFSRIIRLHLVLYSKKVAAAVGIAP